MGLPEPGVWRSATAPASWRRYVDLTLELLARDLAQRYRGTLLGGLWLVLQPLGMLAVFTFVLTQVFAVRWPGAPADAPVAYVAVMVLCGMVTYGIFSDALTRACTTIVGSANLVKRVVFPLEVLPVVTVLGVLVNGLWGYGTVLAFSLVLLESVPLTVLLLPVALLPLVLWTLGLGWLVAALGVFVRDLGHGLGILLQALYFLSPVLFAVEQAPSWARPIMGLNPIAIAIADVRAVLVLGTPPRGLLWAANAGSGLVVSALGFLFFRRVKGAFADVL